jgi:hypothetical protein
LQTLKQLVQFRQRVDVIAWQIIAGLADRLNLHLDLIPYVGSGIDRALASITRVVNHSIIHLIYPVARYVVSDTRCVAKKR